MVFASRPKSLTGRWKRAVLAKLHSTLARFTCPCIEYRGKAGTSTLDIELLSPLQRDTHCLCDLCVLGAPLAKVLGDSIHIPSELGRSWPWFGIHQDLAHEQRTGIQVSFQMVELSKLPVQTIFLGFVQLPPKCLMCGGHGAKRRLELLLLFRKLPKVLRIIACTSSAPGAPGALHLFDCCANSLCGIHALGECSALLVRGHHEECSCGFVAGPNRGRVAHAGHPFMLCVHQCRN